MALEKFRKFLCSILEWALIIAVATLTLVVLWGVITRYLFGDQAKWSEELARYLLIWVSLLGGAAAFGEKAHLGVDYFVGLMDPASQKLMAVFGYIMVLFFAVSVFIIGGWQLVSANIASGQTTPALQIKMWYVYSVVPISGVFIIVFTIVQLIETIFGIEAEKEAK